MEYLNDSYLKELETGVMEVTNGKFIVLEKTCFYPNGGGQPFDTGTITKGNEVFTVKYVGKFNGKTGHEVDREGLQEGDQVSCRIDWERRHKLMRSHTAAHILSEVLHRSTGAMITGNQLDIDKCRIDFSLENYSPEQMKKYIDDANNVISTDLPVSVSSMNKADIDAFKMTKLAKGLPEGLEKLRIVSIGDFDIQADGGTHVSSTKEIGSIELIKCENKGKNNRRLYFSVS